jgi:predicted nucleic acid-binding protein
VIVVDASILANVIGDDGTDGRRARGEIRGEAGIAAPDLVDVETVSVLRRRWLDGTISTRRFSASVDDLEVIDADRYPDTSAHASGIADVVRYRDSGALSRSPDRGLGQVR